MRRVVLLAATLAALATLARASDLPPDKQRSSYQDMAPATRAMQDADTDNPAMLWVLDGEALWTAKTGAADRACADCHGDAKQTMRGVAARHPAFNEKRHAPVSLEGRINICRTDHQNTPALAYESKELLALSAYVALQSRGLPIDSSDPRLEPAIDAGRAEFMRRQGQLNLGCVHCHDQRYGEKLAGSTIPQGHPSGYPIYRLEWQTLGSLQRRLRNCLTGMRAENYAFGSPELVALEAYLMRRARGMAVESPAVRP